MQPIFIPFLGALLPVAIAASFSAAQATRAARPTTDEGGRTYAEIQRKLKQPRPDFAAVASPQLTEALRHPDQLVAFITDPQTPALLRYAAAVQGAHAVPIAQLPEIVAKLDALDRERDLHHWGIRNNPMSAMMQHRLPPGINHDRTILGHPWRLPDELLPFPLTFDEDAKSPWPAQAQGALTSLFNWMTPRGDEPGRASVWFDTAMTMPWATEDEARQFLRASKAPGFVNAPAVMARWRQIAENPATPGAAEEAARVIRESVRLRPDDRAKPLISQTYPPAEDHHSSTRPANDRVNANPIDPVTVTSISVHPSFRGWWLEVRPDGSAKIEYGSTAGDDANLPPGTLDFKALVAQVSDHQTPHAPQPPITTAGLQINGANLIREYPLDEDKFFVSVRPMASGRFIGW